MFFVHAEGSAICLDLKQDCKAVGDGKTDDSGSFGLCQSLLPKGGCVRIPTGRYSVGPTNLNTSHIAWEISNGVVFTEWLGMTKSENAMFSVGGGDKKRAMAYVENITFGGSYSGRVILDLSTLGLYERAFLTTALDGFEFKNMHVKMPFNEAQKCTFSFGNTVPIDTNVSLTTKNGRMINISAVGNTAGYGLIQTQSCENVHFENLDSKGGVTLHMESGCKAEPFLAYVGNITARNITCRDGVAAVMTSPHTCVNGAFHLQELTSYGCWLTLRLEAGFSQLGRPAGTFSNDSTIASAVGHYGLHAQVGEVAQNLTMPACEVCGHRSGNQNTIFNLLFVKTKHVTAMQTGPTTRSRCQI
jgi:hypothetical protein